MIPILLLLKPWHLVLAAFSLWTAFVGVKAYTKGVEVGDKKIVAIQKKADTNVTAAEKARARVKPTVVPSVDCVRDPDCRN